MSELAQALSTKTKASTASQQGTWTNNSTTKKGKRRNASSRKSGDICPIFLQKTFHMIKTCDDSIACWGEDEETSFVVKNPDKFASTIIPQFFKHSNFASFVRQLNFYGFRKIKSDPIKIKKDEVELPESKYWRFRHDKFVKGRPELLLEIRKTDPAPVKAQDDVETMKKQIGNLNDTIANLCNEVEVLENFMNSCSCEDASFVESRESNEIPLNTGALELSPNLFDFSDVTDQDLLLNEIVESNEDNGSGPSMFDPLSGVAHSCHGAFATDAIDYSGFPSIDEDGTEFLHSIETTKCEEEPSPMLEKLYDCLAVLPRQTQEEIINGLEEMVTGPDFIKDYLDTTVELPQMPKNYQPQHVSNTTESETPKSSEDAPTDDVTMKLASGILAAFFAQNRSKNVTNSIPSEETHATFPNVTSSIPSKETHTAFPIHA